MSLPIEPTIGSPDSLAELAATLRRVGYRMVDILKRIDFDYRAWTCGLGMDIPLLFKKRDQLFARPDSDSLDTLTRFLFFGGSTRLDMLEKIFSKHELHALESMHLMVPSEAAREVIFPYGFYEIDGLFVVTDRELLPKAGVSRVMPLFPETYEFTTSRVRTRGRVVDLGTGSGSHALLASQHADKVIGIDINPRAIAFAEFNKALNRADNVEFRLGDLFQGLEGQRFDLITMAPPYLPTDQLSHPIEASGGPRGDAVYARVLAGLDDHLVDGGFAQFSTIMIDWADAPFKPRTLESIGMHNLDHFDVLVLANPFEFRPQILAERWNFNQVPPLLERFMRSDKEYGVLNVRRGGGSAGRYVHAPFVPPLTFAVERAFEAMQDAAASKLLADLLGPDVVIQ
jgi:methylase of polypeptide subunit release factors